MEPGNHGPGRYRLHGARPPVRCLSPRPGMRVTAGDSPNAPTRGQARAFVCGHAKQNLPRQDCGVAPARTETGATGAGRTIDTRGILPTAPRLARAARSGARTGRTRYDQGQRAFCIPEDYPRMTHRRQKRYRDIDGLRTGFTEWRNPIRKRLEEFSAVPRVEYFYELVYCLLTPQSSAVNAGRAVEAMRRSQINGAGPEPVDILANRAHYIRFHKTKSDRILRAREQFPEIALRLSNGATSSDLREWLVHNVNGLGWKEASHFLRNIGHRDLAILDRHILRNLRRHGVIRSLPRTLTQR